MSDELSPLVSVSYGPTPLESSRPPVLIEVPHGATTREHYEQLRSLLQGSYPASLGDFFLVNTDQGAPELALALAERLIAVDPGWSVTVVLAQVPRTFVDFNRVIDPGVDYQGMTPGIATYVHHLDIPLLRDLYRRYHEAVRVFYKHICGQSGGQALMLHTYAPRSVGVDHIDETIGEQLRTAWATPEIWPLRPPIDFIGRGADRAPIADPAIHGRLVEVFGTLGLAVGDSESYYLAASTMAYRYALAHLGHTVCLEVRRDLLAQAFEPFAEMQMDPDQLDRIALALVRALYDPSA